MLSGEATNTNFIVFGLTRPGLNQKKSTALEASTPTIMPQMQLPVLVFFISRVMIYNKDSTFWSRATLNLVFVFPMLIFLSFLTKCPCFLINLCELLLCLYLLSCCRSEWKDGHSTKWGLIVISVQTLDSHVHRVL